MHSQAEVAQVAIAVRLLRITAILVARRDDFDGGDQLAVVVDVDGPLRVEADGDAGFQIRLENACTAGSDFGKGLLTPLTDADIGLAGTRIHRQRRHAAEERLVSFWKPLLHVFQQVRQPQRVNTIPTPFVCPIVQRHDSGLLTRHYHELLRGPQAGTVADAFLVKWAACRDHDRIPTPSQSMRPNQSSFRGRSVPDTNGATPSCAASGTSPPEDARRYMRQATVALGLFILFSDQSLFAQEAPQPAPLVTQDTLPDPVNPVPDKPGRGGSRVCSVENHVGDSRASCDADRTPGRAERQRISPELQSGSQSQWLDLAQSGSLPVPGCPFVGRKVGVWRDQR